MRVTESYRRANLSIVAHKIDRVVQVKTEAIGVSEQVQSGEGKDVRVFADQGDDANGSMSPATQRRSAS